MVLNPEERKILLIEINRKGSSLLLTHLMIEVRAVMSQEQT